MRERTLRWDGCVNVRDLGGLRTEDGGETLFGRVVRADSVRNLSDRGWEAMRAYGVRQVVDLRWPEELTGDPPREVGLQVVHVPLLGDGREDQELDELDVRQRAVADPVERVSGLYLGFVELFRPRFAEAVCAVGRAAEGAVVVHCAGGKDRTGLVCALTLRLAGVLPIEIGSDYAISAQRLEPFLGPWIAEADSEEERESRRRVAAAPAEAMVRVVEGIEERYGSVAAYLRDGGATEAELDCAHTRLRG